MKTYGSEFKRLRKSTGLSQSEMAARIGICGKTVVEIEKERSNPLTSSQNFKFLKVVGQEELHSAMMTLSAVQRDALTFKLSELPEWISAPLVRLYEVMLDDGMTPAEWSQIEDIIDTYMSEEAVESNG